MPHPAVRVVEIVHGPHRIRSTAVGPDQVIPHPSSLIPEQGSLALTDDPGCDASLRAAFQRLDLERACKMTFAQFVADRTRRVSLSNAIEARLRARVQT